MTMEREMLIVKLCVGLLLLAFTVWMIFHTYLHNRRARTETAHHMRIVKLEQLPSNNDRMAELEKRLTEIDEVLANSPFVKPKPKLTKVQ